MLKSLSLVTTKLPVSNSYSIGLITFVFCAKDQKTVEFPSAIMRVPFVVINSFPVVPSIGRQRLATQIMVWIGILLYHMPTYRLLLVAPVEVKKPKAKVPPAETKVSLSERGWIGLRVSLEVE